MMTRNVFPYYYVVGQLGRIIRPEHHVDIGEVCGLRSNVPFFYASGEFRDLGTHFSWALI